MRSLDGYFKSDQFQDYGGLLGRLLSLYPKRVNSQSDVGRDERKCGCSKCTRPSTIAPEMAFRRLAIIQRQQ